MKIKLKSFFTVHETGGVTIIAPAGGSGFSHILKGREALGVIANLMKDGATEEELVSALKNRYRAPDGVIENDVRETLEKLKEIGAIEENG